MSVSDAAMRVLTGPEIYHITRAIASFYVDTPSQASARQSMLGALETVLADPAFSRLRKDTRQWVATAVDYGKSCQVRKLRPRKNQKPKPAEMAAQLAAAANQFRFYEAQHRAKGTADADAKADVNRECAARIESLLAWARKESP